MSTAEPRGDGLFEKAIDLFHECRFRRSLHFARKALGHYRESSHSFGIIKALDLIASAHYSLCDYKEFISCNEEILRLALLDQDLQMEMRAKSSLSDGYFIQGLRDKSSRYVHEALALSGQLGEKAAELNLLAQIAYSEWKTRASIQFYEQSLELSKKDSDFYSVAWTLTNISNVYMREGSYSKAVDCMLQALQVAKAHTFTKDCQSKLESRIFNCLGIAEYNLGNYSSSLSYLNQGIKCARKSSDRYFEAALTANIGLVEEKKGELESATKRHHRTLRVFRHMGARHEEACCHVYLGDDYSQVGDYLNAIKNYSSALRIGNDTNDQEVKSSVFGGMCELACFIGDYQAAMRFAQMRHEMATLVGDPCQEQMACFNMGCVYSLIGDTKEANRFFAQSCEMAILHNDKVSYCKTLCQWGKMGTFGDIDQGNEATKVLDRLSQSYELSSLIGYARGMKESMDALSKEPTSRVAGDFLRLFTCGMFCDIFFAETTCEKIRIGAHRGILACRSPYMRQLLNDSNTGDVVIWEMCSLEILKIILEYIYTGRLTKYKPDQTQELKRVSKEMNLEHLVWILESPLTIDVDASLPSHFVGDSIIYDFKELSEKLLGVSNDSIDSEIVNGTEARAPKFKVPCNTYYDMFLCVEGRTIRCHRAVLSARSWFFQRMLSIGMLESTSSSGDIPEIHLSDISYETAISLVKFIYSGTLEADGSNIMEVLVVADRYQLPRMKRAAEVMISLQLDNENAVNILASADAYNASWLIRKAVQYILHNYTTLRKHSEWDSLNENLREHIEDCHQHLQSRISRIAPPTIPESSESRGTLSLARRPSLRSLLSTGKRMLGFS